MPLTDPPLFRASTANFGDWFAVCYIAAVALLLAATIGFWKMRRWGVYAFLVYAAVMLGSIYWIGETQFQGQQVLLFYAWMPLLIVALVGAFNFARMG